MNSNYNDAFSSPWVITTRGTQEQNGTYDMMGNVYEWNENVIDPSPRRLRGGYFGINAAALASSGRDYLAPPDHQGRTIGFRIASVPEPATVVLMSLGGLALLRRKR